MKSEGVNASQPQPHQKKNTKIFYGCMSWGEEEKKRSWGRVKRAISRYIYIYAF